jgi:hypothetical protein
MPKKVEVKAKKAKAKARPKAKAVPAGFHTATPAGCCERHRLLQGCI